MTSYLLISWILSTIVVGFTQLKYAQANYPDNYSWKFALFISGFTCGAMGAIAFLHQNAIWQDLLLMTAVAGSFAGFVFMFLFPSNMQNFIPKRDDTSKRG